MDESVRIRVRQAALAADRVTEEIPYPRASDILARTERDERSRVRSPQLGRWALAVRLAGAAAVALFAFAAVALVPRPAGEIEQLAEIPSHLALWIDSLYPERSYVVDEVSRHWSAPYDSASSYVGSVFGSVANEVAGRSDG